MKVAVLSESPADEAATRMLVDALLGIRTMPTEVPLRANGWPHVLRVTAPVLQHLYYRTDAEGIVIVADSNDSPPHEPAHEVNPDADSPCRSCRLRRIVDLTCRGFGPTSRPPLLSAIGIAIPAIEAWYLTGSDPMISESAWRQGLEQGRRPYSRGDLKTRVYGTDRPPLTIETARAIESIRGLCTPGGLSLLEQRFPSGFGALAESVRSWRR